MKDLEMGSLRAVENGDSQVFFLIRFELGLCLDRSLLNIHRLWFEEGLSYDERGFCTTPRLALLRLILSLLMMTFFLEKMLQKIYLPILSVVLTRKRNPRNVK